MPTESASSPPPATAPARTGKVVRWTAAVLLGLAALGAAGVALWLPNDEALARRAERALADALGTPVRIDALAWQLLPVPQVTLQGLSVGPVAAGATGSAQEDRLSAQRIVINPALTPSSLWTRSFRLHKIDIDGAEVPQRMLAGLGALAQPDAATAPDTTSPLLETLVWRNVSWQPRYGPPFVVSGRADFDAQWRPREAALQLDRAETPTDITLTRQGLDDRWTVRSRLGGGTVNGDIALQNQAGAWSLTGTLAPQNVEVASAMAAFNRRAVVRGKASGTTTVAATSRAAAGSAGSAFGGLAQSLRTTTRFSMGPGEWLRFDLNKAVGSAGTDTKGQTPLDTLTGQMVTQNTPNGMQMRFVGIKATSGALSAVGDATLANRQIDATLAVDLVDGVVGVPLRITGPISNVKVSVPPSALAGAAVGTAVAPGVGTALGARLGAAIGRLFGTDKPAAPPERR